MHDTCKNIQYRQIVKNMRTRALERSGVSWTCEKRSDNSDL